MMVLGVRQFAVRVGDTICTDPGTEHKISNTGQTDLKFIDISSPPYQHEDTVITEPSRTE